MITRLTLKNFKAWRELEIRFGKVTGLFGANSSGKSSLLQFLLMLKQTKNATDRRLALDLGSSASLINLGSFRDIVYQHDVKSTISWSLDWRLQEILKVEDAMSSRSTVRFQSDELRTECAVDLRNASPWSHDLVYEFDNTLFSLRPSSEGSTKFELHSKDFRFVRNRGRPWQLPGPIKTHLFPDQAKTFYQNADFLSKFEWEYETLMDRVFYLGPLREHPKREYTWSGAKPDDVGQRGERTVDAILAASADEEKRNLGRRKRLKPFQEFIADWLKTLGLIESFSVREVADGSNIYQAKVKKDSSSAEVLLTDVGFGVSQVLPALVLLYYVPEGSTILMEQPEIHLHPSAQSGLADAILKAVDTRDVQVIVESHSEHLMRRLQRRVAENESLSRDVKLYFVSMERGSAQLSDLRLNEWGEIENWPDNFFGDELAEIAAMRLATLERKIKASQIQ
ncbi:MAG: DUF3696 domain-containing protein [Aphanocapsa feldmannii 277cV]|uniref:DUF3696 domain-containing protein n=1 Tax=Aphanocapsa feldmannii 277cV TaxID=2507553 RepID=A0A524RRZ0_9CHRO|nr:MAG: DUF3696 domain-containing protein [Aphanocapsa feldmannii 277cV]